MDYCCDYGDDFYGDGDSNHNPPRKPEVKDGVMFVVSEAGFMVPNDRQYSLLGKVMRLDQEYDPRQLWFFFVDALIKHPEIPKPVGQKLITRLGIKRILEKPYADLRVGDSARDIYVYVKGVEQIVMPYEEYKMVQDTEWRRLMETNCPGWDKISGTPPRINMSGKDFKEAKEWLIDNCRGRFRYKSRSVRFERLTDYAMAKLRFS